MPLQLPVPPQAPVQPQAQVPLQAPVPPPAPVPPQAQVPPQTPAQAQTVAPLPQGQSRLRSPFPPVPRWNGQLRFEDEHGQIFTGKVMHHTDSGGYCIKYWRGTDTGHTTLTLCALLRPFHFTTRAHVAHRHTWHTPPLVCGASLVCVASLMVFALLSCGAGIRCSRECCVDSLPMAL